MNPSDTDGEVRFASEGRGGYTPLANDIKGIVQIIGRSFTRLSRRSS
jgi:hypothetical protein